MGHGGTITVEQLSDEKLHLQGKGRALGIPLLVVGALLVTIGYFVSDASADNGRRFLFSYLVAFVYIASLSLGALFFTVLQHLTRAAWSVVIRRLAEVMASNIWWVGALGLVVIVPLLAGRTDIYEWMNPVAVEHSPLLQHKAAFLNRDFFFIRLFGYFAFWIWLAFHMLGTSVKQDKSGDAKLTLGLWRLSAPTMVLFALTLTFFMIDLIMSLDPTWFSTMIGVYYFAGAALSFFSIMALTCMLLQQQGFLKRVISLEHYHDLGKLMFAFVFFWGYIAFSQFMLIWYANIPEEIHWFVRREQGGLLGPEGLGWLGLGYILLFCHILIPFSGLLSRWIKRNKPFLGFWTIWILVVHWLDHYWLIMPEFLRGAEGLGAAERAIVPFAPVDFLCWFGLLALWLGMLALRAENQPLIPLKDPLLADSLAFDNIKV